MFPLSWAPFLEKRPPKITEGGPVGPHWLTSRINPGSLYYKSLDMIRNIPPRGSDKQRGDCYEFLAKPQVEISFNDGF